ncbi:MAG: hypothetical protein Q9195_009645, partial [Heterodermia aff. obscurata]
MTSVDIKPLPLNRVESQYDDLIGSADVDDAAALLVGHTNAIGDGPKISAINGAGSQGGVDDGAKGPPANGTAEKAAPSEEASQPNFPTGTEKPSVIPPLQPEGKKNNKAVPWYHKTINEIDPITRNILENYSQIPSDQVEQHVIAI